MSVSPELLQQITDAVKNRPAVIPEQVRLASKPLAVTVNRKGDAYANPRVTENMDEKIGQGTKVEYLKFIPLEEAGVVILRRSRLGEDGAVPFLRSGSGRTGRFDLRSALAGFRLNYGSNRTLRCTYDSVEVEGEGEGATKEFVGVIQVKNPRRRRGTHRRKAEPAPAQPAV